MDNLVVSNIRQRPVRSLVSVIGVALGVALVMLFTGLSRGMSHDLQKRSANVRAEIIFTRKGTMDSFSGSNANLSTAYVEKLLQVKSVQAAVPVIHYVSQGGGFGIEQVEGLDWKAFAVMNEMHMLVGDPPVAINDVVIDESKARNSHLTVGSDLLLFGGRKYRVAGIYGPESGSRIKMTLEAMQDALEVPGKCSYILVKAKSGASPDELAANINTDLPGNKVQLARDVFTSVEGSIPALGIFLRVIAGLAAVVSALVVMLAMYTTITERTREIGILKALGASRIYIVSVIEKEALVISALGLVLGFSTSIIIGAIIHRQAGLMFEYGWRWALTAGLIGMLGGGLGALYPAVRAANLDAVVALAHD